MVRKLLPTISLLAAIVVALVACERDARVASRNLSKAAEMFEVQRRIVFYNGITDSYMLVIEGRCSLEISQDKVMVTCKVSDTEFKKHYLVRSDNTTLFAEQLDPNDVSVYHNRIVFKPQQIVPELDVRGDSGELLKDRY
jgi:putative NADH-flavin reductase